MNSKFKDSIVISGMSGRFPKSRTINDLKYNLFNKIDMIEPCKKEWKIVNDMLPDRFGKVPDVDKFDSEFFGISFDYANEMDPQARMMIEHVYEAILDAGVSPKTLRGSNTAVYVGCFVADSHESSIRNGNDNELTGSLRTFLPNLVSYVMDFKGPSCVVDSACSSSGYAADMAIKAIKNGECNQAIVVGTNLLLGVSISSSFFKSGVLAKDGVCRAFDEDANGYVRSDGIAALFLQKFDDAKRNYAHIVHTRTTASGFKKEGLPFPSRVMQIDLLEKFYKDIDIDPNTVDYVDAHSTGTKVGDPEECAALDLVLCSNRSKPLLIGTIKSNLGHTEATSTCSSIVKSILAFENRKLAPNLNFNTLRTGIPSLQEGRIKVVDELQDFDGSLIGINSFGVSGANIHVLLKSHDKEKVNGAIPTDDLPRLVLWSGRSEEAINTIFDNLEANPMDAEYIALLQNSQISTYPMNTYRGYGLFSYNQDDGTTKCNGRSVENFVESKRPIVFVYTGMGAQWTGMISDLQKIPIFKKSIENCHKALLPNGINLIEILSSSDEQLTKNVIYSYVGMAAIQIALTDVLKSINIVPDYIIGHSAGELVCAYCDECNTAEEVILAASTRGVATIETDVIRGAMAAVGMGHEELKDMLIDGVEIACHNSSTSSTISGPADVIAEFVEKLKQQKIFVKEVNSSNIPYHSSYISHVGPKLLSSLQDIIKNPKKRSSKWISTSVPKDLQESPESKLSSAEYHTNNLLNPVLFQEALELLPKNALTIEIAPYGLLQAILKRSMTDGVHMSLTKKDDRNNSLNLLHSLGKMFQNGVDMDISKLYPPIEFPVSRGTPMISPLVKWDHSQSLNEHKVEDADVHELKVVINLSNPNFKFLEGHKIAGKVIFPAAGYIYYARSLAAALNRKLCDEFDFECEDVRLLKGCFLSTEKDTTIKFVYQSGDGRFEAHEGKTLLCTGFIRPTTATITECDYLEDDLSEELSSDEYYKELRIRGFQFDGMFKTVIATNINCTKVKVKATSNWILFLDSFLQSSCMCKDFRVPIIPTKIDHIIFKPQELKQFLENSSDPSVITAHTIVDHDLLICPGLELRGIDYYPIPHHPQSGIVLLGSYDFISYIPTPLMQSQYDGVSFCVFLLADNLQKLEMKFLEIGDYEKKDVLSRHFAKVFELFPIIYESVYVTDDESIEAIEGVKIKKLSVLQQKSQYDVIITSNIDRNLEIFEQVKEQLNDFGFLIVRENLDSSLDTQIPEMFKLIAKVRLENEYLFLLKIFKTHYEIPSTAIKFSLTGTDKYEWFDSVKETFKTKPIILYSENDSESGILGFANCLQREPGANVTCVLIDDPNAPKFSIDNDFYVKQLEKGLRKNVYRNGQWGSYNHQRLSIDSKVTEETCAFADVVRGDLSSLRWVQSPLKINNEEDLIKIHYASLNFRDVMIGTGRIPVTVFGESRLNHEHVLGCEFVGETTSGRRVMGIKLQGLMATHCCIDKDLILIDLPDNWTMEEGATVFLTYITIYKILRKIRSEISEGDAILIHAGSGGVGLSAIHLATHMGFEIFTTVSTEEKKQYLLEQFPHIKPENIGNSRNTSFRNMIMKNTGGKGVKVVINSLGEEKLLTTLKCLSYNGFFIEIGKSDIFRDNKINLKPFAKGLTFMSINVDFDQLKTEPGKKTLNNFEAAMQSNIIKPLKATIFDANQLEEAFRFMASGKHIGKILIKIRDENGLLMKEIIPKVYFNPKHSYIICGGLGGFGIELADWMIVRGCRKLVLSSSRGKIDPFHKYRFILWKKIGAEIKISTSNIATESGCDDLIEEASQLGPVGGIFNLAARLSDALFENQTIENFEECNRPKGIATKCLDVVSRKKCKELEYFVAFSSIACGIGNIGQTNYGMANSIMERIIENRKRDGLPAKAIQWGPIGDVGMFMAESKNDTNVKINAMVFQKMHSCLEVLDSLLTSKDATVYSYVVQEKFFSSDGKSDMLNRLLKMMGIKDINAYPKDTKITEFGMDSLLTVEIIQYAEKALNVILTVDDLRSMTIGTLSEMIENKN